MRIMPRVVIVFQADLGACLVSLFLVVRTYANNFALLYADMTTMHTGYAYGFS